MILQTPFTSIDYSCTIAGGWFTSEQIITWDDSSGDMEKLFQTTNQNIRNSRMNVGGRRLTLYHVNMWRYVCHAVGQLEKRAQFLQSVSANATFGHGPELYLLANMTPHVDSPKCTENSVRKHGFRRGLFILRREQIALLVYSTKNWCDVKLWTLDIHGNAIKYLENWTPYYVKNVTGLYAAVKPDPTHKPECTSRIKRLCETSYCNSHCKFFPAIVPSGKLT